MSKKKTSYGIALCAKKNGMFKILMIKKKYTYSFFDFVYGKYKKKDSRSIMVLLNNMTYIEKSLISKLNFGRMWEYIWGFNPEYDVFSQSNKNFKKGLNIFFQKKAQFDSYFAHNSGKRINGLIKNSVNAEAVWEIPKGRKKINETEIDAAMREFNEETSVSSSKYKIFWHVAPIIDTYYTSDVLYTTKYFLAGCLTNNLNPRVFFKNKEQCDEIQNIKWISSNEIKFLYMGKKKQAHLIKLFKKIKYMYP